MVSVRITQVSFLLSVALFLAGAALQQFALFRRSKQYTSLPEDCRSAQSTSFLLFTIGLVGEVVAFALLPLATVTILGSVLVLLYTLQLATDEERTMTAAEKKGAVGIVLGCLTVIVWGGEGKRLQKGEFEDVFSATYFLWMLGSLTFNCTLRRLGFYEGRPLLESCIPAQITAIGIAALKFMLLALESCSEAWYVFSVGLSALVSISALHVSSAFLSLLHHKHDKLVTIGSYYAWLIMYQLPMGVTVLAAGTEYTLANYAGLTVSAALVTAGAGLIAYVRAAEQEADAKDKKLAFSAVAGRPGTREGDSADEGRLIRT